MSYKSTMAMTKLLPVFFCVIVMRTTYAAACDPSCGDQGCSGTGPKGCSGSSCSSPCKLGYFWDATTGCTSICLKESPNYAVGKPTRTSSTYLSKYIPRLGPSSLAVDGDIAYNIPYDIPGLDCAYSSTVYEHNPWWAVDLQEKIFVTNIVFYRREDYHDIWWSALSILVGLRNPFVGSMEWLDDYGMCKKYYNEAPDTGPKPNNVFCRYPRRIGQFVVFHLSGRNFTLSLCEVEVYGGRPHNYAVGKPTRQSWDHIYRNNTNSKSSLAVDGKIEYDTDGYDCYHPHTAESKYNAWWAVDLQENVLVVNIEFWRRKHYDWWERMNGLTIYIGSRSPYVGYYNSRIDLTNFHVCKSWPKDTVPHSVPKSNDVMCDQSIRGRYVVFQLQGMSELSLCEVEVYSNR